MTYFKWIVTEGFLNHLREPLIILAAVFALILLTTGILVLREVKKERAKEDAYAQRPSADTAQEPGGHAGA